MRHPAGTPQIPAVAAVGRRGRPSLVGRASHPIECVVRHVGGQVSRPARPPARSYLTVPNYVHHVTRSELNNTTKKDPVATLQFHQGGRPVSSSPPPSTALPSGGGARGRRRQRRVHPTGQQPRKRECELASTVKFLDLRCCSDEELWLPTVRAIRCHLVFASRICISPRIIRTSGQVHGQLRCQGEEHVHNSISLTPPLRNPVDRRRCGIFLLRRNSGVTWHLLCQRFHQGRVGLASEVSDVLREAHSW